MTLCFRIGKRDGLQHRESRGTNLDARTRQHVSSHPRTRPSSTPHKINSFQRPRQSILPPNHPLHHKPWSPSRRRPPSMDTSLLRLARRHQHMGFRKLLRCLPNILLRHLTRDEFNHIVDWLHASVFTLRRWDLQWARFRCRMVPSDGPTWSSDPVRGDLHHERGDELLAAFTHAGDLYGDWRWDILHACYGVGRYVFC